MHSYVLNIETDEGIFECKVKKNNPNLLYANILFVYFLTEFCLQAALK